MVGLKIEDCLNANCPFSGDRVEAGSLLLFEGHTFGFCNPGCRDKFAANPAAYPEVVANFRACAEPPGNWHKPFAEIEAGLEHGLFHIAWQNQKAQVELYEPRGKDLQAPHDRDEIYIIDRGSGTFSRAGTMVEFGPGDVIYVPKGQDHRFETFSEGFRTWVVFWG